MKRFIAYILFKIIWLFGCIAGIIWGAIKGDNKMMKTAFVTGMCIGILIGMAFIMYIAGHDWDTKVNAKKFSWKNVDYKIVEIEENG